MFSRAVGAIGEIAGTESGRRVLPASITQQQIAARIGATRELVNHVFRELTKARVLIREANGSWLIAKLLPRH